MTDKEGTSTVAHSPRCPTCGSGEVERIKLDPSLTAARAVSTLVFGPRKFEKQFECKNCGYRW